MFKKDKLLSLFVVLLMLITAAITVNKTVFGYDIRKSDTIPEAAKTLSDPISEEEDGTLVIHSQGIPGSITGYAGSVPLDIYISDGKITDIKALENAETPSFFERAAAILPSWIGKNPAEAQSLKVDAVSGATFSSAAIINNVNVALAYYNGLETKSNKSKPLKIWIALVVTLAACIIPVFIKNKIYRNLQLAANVIVLGFWCGQFLDYSLILKYISSGFTWPAGLIAILMLTAAFIYPIFGHTQHYCTYICPLGSAQQLMAEVCGYKIKISAQVIKILEWSRRILWAALMLLLWADCWTEWMDWELFQTFMYQSAPLSIIIIASVFILLSSIISRPYCRFVCPTGSLFKRAENIG